jgi:hypothetical protein
MMGRKGRLRMEPEKQREDREEACGKGHEEIGFCRLNQLGYGQENAPSGKRRLNPSS